jgi:hypothetical protein
MTNNPQMTKHPLEELHGAFKDAYEKEGKPMPFGEQIGCDKPHTAALLVTCRVEHGGREFNPEIPVIAAGYDDAIAKVKEALEKLGMKFCFVHTVHP